MSSLIKTETLTYVVVGIAVIVGAISVVSQNWFYTDFESAPRPEGALLSPNQIPDPNRDGIKRETIRFPCNSTAIAQQNWMCDGWLYTPTQDLSLQNNDKEFPVVIMAHGLGVTKDMGLDKFAKQFAKNGMMVLVFDYLHFGLSDGYPRHRINPMQHVMDYESAVHYVKSNVNVDSKRIALWGTSFAGGHVLVTASKKPSIIKAVISQMPFLGSIPGESPLDELKKRGIGNVLKGFIGVIASKLRRMMGQNGFYSRLYGHIGDNEALALNYWETIDADETMWLAKHPKNRNNDWRNAVFSESLLDLMKYKPVKYVDAIDTKRTKVMIVQAKHDKICPNNRMEYVIKRLKCESHMEDTGHYGMYTGDTFKSVIKVQVDFFKKNLKPSTPQMKVLD